MLTILGSKGGADVFWCGFRISGFPTNGVSANASNFIGPLPFRLPPNNGRYYYVAKDGFGIAGEEIPIGYLESDDSPIRIPKPCQHLNATGTILMRPETGFVKFAKGNWNDFLGKKTYLSPSVSSPTVKLFDGFPTLNGAYNYWTTEGLIKRSATSDYYRSMYCGYPIGNPCPSGSVPYKFGQKVYYPIAPYTFNQRYVEFRFSPILQSLSDFTFEGEYADHVLPGTQGTYYNMTGSYKMHQICGNTDGTFSIYGDYESLIRSWIIDSYGKRIERPDVIEKTSSWRALHLISPISNPANMARITPKLEKDLYEIEALAKSSHSEETFYIARNNAMADVTALKSNNLENISGLKGSFSVIGSLVEGYRAVTNGNIRDGMKALSSAYLWYSYALAPSVSDAGDIAENTKRISLAVGKNRFSNERRRGQVKITNVQPFTEIIYSVTYHTRLRDNVYADLYNKLSSFGLHPSVSQGWDFVPFSFVLDWFIDVGPTLERLSNYNSFILMRDIKSRIESYKAIVKEDHRVSDDPSMYEFLGPYEQSYYQRLIYSGPGTVSPFVGQDTAGNRTSQMMQGTSLLIQQLD